jgi:hypothetical protein
VRRREESLSTNPRGVLPTEPGISRLPYELPGLDVADHVVPVADLELRVLEGLDLNDQVRDIEVLDGRDTIGSVEKKESVASRKARDDWRILQDPVGGEAVDETSDPLEVDPLVQEEVGHGNDSQIGKPPGRLGHW